MAQYQPSLYGWGARATRDPFRRYATPEEEKLARESMPKFQPHIYYCDICCEEVEWRTEREKKRHILQCTQAQKEENMARQEAIMEKKDTRMLELLNAFIGKLTEDSDIDEDADGTLLKKLKNKKKRKKKNADS